MIYRIITSELIITTLLHVNFIKCHLKWRMCQQSTLGLCSKDAGSSRHTTTSNTDYLYQLWGQKKALSNKLLILPPSFEDTTICNKTYKLLRYNLLRFFRVLLKNSFIVYFNQSIIRFVCVVDECHILHLEVLSAVNIFWLLTSNI